MSGYATTPTAAGLPPGAQQQAMFGATPGAAPTPGLFTPPTAPGHRGVAEVLEEAVRNGSTELLAGLKKQLAVFTSQPPNEAAAKKVLEDLMEDQTYLAVFAIMGEGAKVRWVWGMGKIFDPMGKMDVTTGYTAFVGDRSKSGSPPPMVKLPQQNMFKGVTVKTHYDDDAFVAYYDKEENSNSFFTAEDGATQESVWLPYLLYLPGELGAFVSKKSRTRQALLKEAKRLEADPTCAVSEGDLALVRKWCIGAATKATNSSNSSLYLGNLITVTSDAEEFHTCLQKKCDAILGPVGPQLGQVELEQARMQAFANTMVSSMMTMQNQLSRGQINTPGGGDASGLPKGRDFEAAEKVKIAALSGQDNYAGASSIWRELQSKTSLVSKRDEVAKRIATIANRLGYEFNQTIFLPKSFFDEVLACKFCCDEAVATFVNLDKGFSPQVFLETTLEFISEQQAEERAEDESKAQRTYTESLNLNKKKPRLPPTTFAELGPALATYAAGLEAFWTKNSPLLHDVLVFRNAMTLSQVVQMKKRFTSNVIVSHWYNICAQSRAYFATPISEADLRADPPRFPQSLLKHALNLFISGMPVEHAMFPTQWAPYRTPAGPTPTGASPFGTGSSGKQLEWGAPKDPPPGDNGNLTLDQRLSHCHPTIRAEFKELHELFDGKVRFMQLCHASNIGVKDLPFLYSCGSGDNNNLCYNNVMGVCNNPTCRRAHVLGRDLPQPFVDELCTKTRPGRDYLLKQEKAKGKGGGPGNKRARKS